MATSSTNNVPISSIVLAKTLKALKQTSVALRYCHIDLGDKLAPNNGKTITGTKPFRPTVVRDTPDLTNQFQNINEATYTLTTKRVSAIIDMDTADRTYEVSKEKFDNEFIPNTADRMAREVDEIFFETLAGSASFRVKRADYTKGLTISDASAMKASLSRMLAPKQGRVIALSADEMAYASDDMKGLFNPQKKISNAVEMGEVEGHTVGLDWVENQSTGLFTLKDDVASGAVDGTVSAGATQIVLQTLLKSDGTTPATGTISAGTAFVVSGVKQIDPQTGEAKKNDYTFIVQEDATITGAAATVKVMSAINATFNTTTKQYANVSALPQDDAVVSFLEVMTGTTDKTAELAYAWHPEAIVCATKVLFTPEDGRGVIADSINRDGISMRYLKFGNGLTDRWGDRLDMDIGFTVAQEELLASIVGKLG